MNENPNYYAIIPAEVRYDKDLSSTAKLLYAEITSLCSKSGECWASNEYFSNLYSISERTISRLLKLLKDKNYISIELIYKSKSKEIEKRAIKLANVGIDKNVEGYRQKCQEGIDKNVFYPIDKNVQENNINNINNTSINNIPPIIPHRRCIIDNKGNIQFDYFWKLYPRKEKKSNAKKWFEKNKISDELFELIISKLELFKKTESWNKDDGKYIPYAITWLNQKRWEDEIKIAESKEEENERIRKELENEFRSN